MLGGERVGGARQVVAFVEHHEAETRAEVLHVDEGGVVGGDRDGLHAMLAAAEHADRAPQPLAQQPMPLRDEIEGGRHDERVAPHGIQRQQRHFGLPGPGRQHHHAPRPRRPPGVHGLRLKRARIPTHLQAGVQNAVLPRLVLVGDPALHQRANHRGIGDGRRTEPPGAGIPAAGVRQRSAALLRESADVQRAGDEAQGNGQKPSGAGARDSGRRSRYRLPSNQRTATPRPPDRLGSVPGPGSGRRMHCLPGRVPAHGTGLV